MWLERASALRRETECDCEDDDEEEEEAAEWWKSGWEAAWSWRNSRRKARTSIEKGPVGGGPVASVCGKRA